MTDPLPTGEIDLVTRHGWTEVLAAMDGNDAPGRLDLSALSFIDVRGATALVDAARRMTPGTQLTLYRPPQCLRRMLDLLHADKPPAILIDDDAHDGEKVTGEDTGDGERAG